MTDWKQTARRLQRLWDDARLQEERIALGSAIHLCERMARGELVERRKPYLDELPPEQMADICDEIAEAQPAPTPAPAPDAAESWVEQQPRDPKVKAAYDVEVERDHCVEAAADFIAAGTVQVYPSDVTELLLRERAAVRAEYEAKLKAAHAAGYDECRNQEVQELEAKLSAANAEIERLRAELQAARQCADVEANIAATGRSNEW